MVRIVGLILVVAGVIAVTLTMHAAFTRRRPIDLLAALAVPVAIVVTLLGALLLFVPGFLG